MVNLLGSICKAFRYCVAAVGCVLSSAFLAFGLVLHESKNESVEDDLIIAFGAFVLLLSIIIGYLNGGMDRAVKRLIDSFERQLGQLQMANERLSGNVQRLEKTNEQFVRTHAQYEEQLKAAEKRHREKMQEFKEQNEKLGVNIGELERERRELGEENRELRDTLERLEQLQTEYKDHLQSMRESHAAATAELDRLKLLAVDEEARIRQLEKLNAQQKTSIVDMEAQLEHMNELQRKSTKMIQMLALYGDECKTMGQSLKDVSGELRETDSSLGLTAQEMTVQIKALGALTDDLTRVAAARGILE